jgi:hypothetical protein
MALPPDPDPDALDLAPPDPDPPDPELVVEPRSWKPQIAAQEAALAATTTSAEREHALTR